jgi:hypothetical protein
MSQQDDAFHVGPEAPVYSFRAACPYDFDQFVRTAIDAGMAFSILQVTKGSITGFIEPHVEIRTLVALDWLQAVMRSIDNGHVMLQTLRQLPLSENSMVRDYELE